MSLLHLEVLTVQALRRCGGHHTQSTSPENKPRVEMHMVSLSVGSTMLSTAQHRALLSTALALSWWGVMLCFPSTHSAPRVSL